MYKGLLAPPKGVGRGRGRKQWFTHAISPAWYGTDVPLQSCCYGNSSVLLWKPLQEPWFCQHYITNVQQIKATEYHVTIEHTNHIYTTSLTHKYIHTPYRYITFWMMFADRIRLVMVIHPIVHALRGKALCMCILLTFGLYLKKLKKVTWYKNLICHGRSGAHTASPVRVTDTCSKRA